LVFKFGYLKTSSHLARIEMHLKHGDRLIANWLQLEMREIYNGSQSMVELRLVFFVKIYIFF